MYGEERPNEVAMKDEVMDTEEIISGNFSSYQDQVLCSKVDLTFQTFESLSSLLMEVSPSFKNQFHQTLSAKLLMLQFQQQNENVHDDSMKEEL